MIKIIGVPGKIGNFCGDKIKVRWMAKQKVLLRIHGMHCASCVVSIEKHVNQVRGVLFVLINFAQEQAEITYDSNQISLKDIIDAIAQVGYRAQRWQVREDELASLEAKDELKVLKIKLIVSSVLLALLFIGKYIPGMGILFTHPWMIWLLATPVQFWAGFQFYQSAWQGLKHGRTNMNTLISLGTSVAYFYSIFVVVFENWFQQSGLPTHLYFDAAAAIITFILLGNFLEIRAKRRTSVAIKKLVGLQPKTALVFNKEQQEWVELPIVEVVIKSMIRIKPGNRIPVDGIIMSGSSSIDESMVTGESMPILKKEGDEVIGGTISMTGSFDMKATKVGRETVLAKIIQLVQSAQASKAPVQKLVDQVSSVFVPTVIVLSVLTFILWLMFGPEPRFLYAIVSMVSVFIIACPCALGLATPTSIMVGIGRGAQEGILIKSAQTLEVAGKINVVVFDKTGTLTRGHQEVHKFEVVQDLDSIFDKIGWQLPQGSNARSYALTLVYKLEELSDHPISQAVMRYLQHEKAIDAQMKDKVILKDFASVAGLGLRGYVDNHKIVLGSRQLMESEGVAIAAEIDMCAIEWSQEAKSVSFVAFDDVLIAYFCVADTIRDGAKDTIAKLKRIGISSILITGDNQLSANAVARALGIDKALAQVLPADKAKEVKRLCKEGKVVAMVGDGINDAPALASADVGIAMGSGTDVALETAWVALLRSDITLVPKVITLSRATIRNIRQNLIWAFGYNVFLIPVAMGILYPLFGVMLNPMFAGAAMAFSSLSVVLNALRLRKVRL